MKATHYADRVTFLAPFRVARYNSASGHLPGRRGFAITTLVAADPEIAAPAVPVDQPRARPFLKWAGGKTQLLPALLERAPRSIDTYYEPFMGGGALFFALAADPDLAPRRAVLNDMNHELVTAYTVVRDHLDELVARLEVLAANYLEGDAEARAANYYAVRDEQRGAPVEVAARLIFLNKTCFNGLYRVNRQGRFNVPHGRYQKPNILDRDNLTAASAALQHAEITHGDFETACAEARAGDFVYLDPPFHPLSETANFTAYTEGSFGRPEQLRLRWCVDKLSDRGVAAMVSNSPHEWVVGAYEAGRYRVERTPARRAINSKGDRRGAIDELVVTNDYTRRGRIDSIETAR
ncbi:MAG: DNA adenine methylase [Chloroflexi bacterium]|nr:DNA adenine methylase [Chloroflexota bacterium]MDA1146600.1 DNA adenine methylase [Chloroflexota bacterium]MQC82712.1 DNA adenine methylase [Chloroflexota bacterium]